MRLHRARLRTRVIFFVIALVAIVQLISFALVTASRSRAAQARVDSEVEVGRRILNKLLRHNAESLIQAARLLTADPAMQEAVATQDAGAIAAALEVQRSVAHAIMLVSLDGTVLADTLQHDQVPRTFGYPRLLERADTTGAAVSVENVAGKSWQLVAIPVRAPQRSGWLVVGSALEEALARDVKQLTNLDVTFLPNAGDEQSPRVAFSHRPRSAVSSPFDRSALSDPLNISLLALAIASLIVALAGATRIARDITQPLRNVANAASRMAQGDFVSEVPIQRTDEIGALACALDDMRENIADREKRILTLAYRDQLTGLANRAKFFECLGAAIDAARPAAEAVSLFVMDLDRFKYVNDTLGHGVGDHVLREVASLLSRTVPTANCIARLGGDEFAVLLTGPNATKVVDVAKAIVAALTHPILYQDQPLDVGTSVGIARFPQHGQDTQRLARSADVAMYVAKRNKSGVAIYNAYYDTTQQEHLSLLGELRRAVDHNELRLVFQPKLSLRSSNVSAVEALIRWQHPAKGVIHPAHFMPFAEATGYIKVLTAWVLREAIRQSAEWLGVGLKLQISVNISARDLLNGDLPGQIAALLAEHCVPAGLICLEISESGFMEDPAHAQKMLERLSAMGLRLSIDDYGSGYSSLAYVMNLPVQELKIDRSFIHGITAGSDMSTLVRSTIELGHNLGMTVVAEGVEDGKEWNRLKTMGCDDAQGYFMSPPLAPAALVAWMREHDGKESRARSVRTSNASRVS